MIWGRSVTALLILLQGHVNVKRTRPQGYTHDPIFFLLRGTTETYNRVLTLLCLHVAVLGITTIARQKAARGQELERKLKSAIFALLIGPEEAWGFHPPLAPSN